MAAICGIAGVVGADGPEVAVGLAERRVDFEGAPVRCGGLVKPAEVFEGDAQVGVGFHRRGLDVQRPAA